jgi:hypothetical protein
MPRESSGTGEGRQRRQPAVDKEHRGLSCDNRRIFDFT